MRIFAFIIDWLIVGVLVFITLEPFYGVQFRYNSGEFFLENISSIIFILYIFLSLLIFKQTIGMRLFKLKLSVDDGLFKVAMLRTLLIPFYILNIIWFPLRKKYLQDEISGSFVYKQSNLY